MPILVPDNTEQLLGGGNAYCETLDLGICFAAGTPVLMADGTTKPIETLQPGDRVLSAPENDVEGAVAAKTVERVFHNPPSELIRLTIGGTELRSTPPHLFYVRDKGWTAAEDLQVGDQLRTPDARWVTLDAKQTQPDPEPVFNFRVADYHTYFVGDPGSGEAVLVHNEYDKDDEEWSFWDYFSAEKNGINDFFTRLENGLWDWAWSGDNQTVREYYLAERQTVIPKRVDLLPALPQFWEAGKANREYLEHCERRRVRDLERLDANQLAREHHAAAQQQSNANIGTAVTPYVSDGRDAYEVFVGKDYHTGERLTPADRAIV